MITFYRQPSACIQSIKKRNFNLSYLSIMVCTLLWFILMSPSRADESSSTLSQYVKPTLSKVSVSEYIWIRNFKRFATREAAIKAACEFVDYNAIDHRCPIEVKLAEGSLGYGLYVHFNKKTVEWENFSTHIEKFDVVKKLEAECLQDDYQVPLDLDNDGRIDRCLPNAKITSL